MSGHAGPGRGGDVVSVRFLVHGAERSGPPIYLLRLLRQWRSQNTEIDAEVVLARPGPLAPAFAAVAPTRIARLDPRSPESVVRRVLGAARLQKVGGVARTAATRLRVGRSEPDITVVNGATQPTADLLEMLAPRGEVVMIAHELSTGWFHNVDEHARSLLLVRVDRYLAVSRTVADFLERRLGVDPSRIAVGRAPIVQDLAPPRLDPDTPDVVHLGGGGPSDWRKAPDSWLRVARHVLDAASEPPRVEFTWIGGATDGDAAFWPLRHDIDHLGLAGHVEFLGDQTDPAGIIGQLDLFVSTAREDAYPLMCVEAASAGVPVVSFDGGGAAELIAESGCGVIVDYPDERGMAAAIVELLEQPSRRRELGAAGRSFASDELDPSATAQAIAEWIIDDHSPLDRV